MKKNNQVNTNKKNKKININKRDKKNKSVTKKNNKKNNKKNKSTKTKKMHGAGFFSSKKKNVANAIKSEERLLELYREYLIAKNDYEKIYTQHLQNLITLEQINDMGNSLVTVFKDIVFPNDIEDFTEYDEENPLLLKSYLVTEDTIPSQFRKEHIMQQILYQIHKLDPEDKELFTSIDIKFKDNYNIEIKFVLRNIFQFIRNVAIAKNYVLDQDQIYENLKDIVTIAKSNKKIAPTLNKQVKLYDNDFKIKNNNVNVPGFDNKFINNTSKLDEKLKDSVTGRQRVPYKKIVPHKVVKSSENHREELLKRKPTLMNNTKSELIDEEKTTGNNAPLTKQQILQFQHQQVLPVEDEPDEHGRPIFAVKDITDDVKKLLGIEVYEPRKKSFYDDMPLDKLKEMDLTKVSKENLDKICARFSDDEETCKKIEQCWFNAKSNPKCYRFKEKNA